MPLLSWDDAKRLCTSPLVRVGFSATEADRVAEHLVAAEAGGVVSLGLSRLAWIVDLVIGGRPAGDPSRATSRGPSHVAVDGNGGLGYLAVEKALALAAQGARTHGVAVASVKNSFLTGVLRVYGSRLAEQGLACVISSSAAPPILVAPGGVTPVLGTNPFAIAVPDRSGGHLVFDTSSTHISYSELRSSAALDQPLPPGVAVDAGGARTTDPRLALQGGLLPWAGHRGYGMATAVAAMGMLAGAPAAADDLASCGFVAMIFDPRVVGSGLADISELRRVLGDSMVDGSAARLPGDRWREAQSAARDNGLQVVDSVYETVRELST